MSPAEYFDLLEPDLRTRSVDDATYLCVTGADWSLLRSNTRKFREGVVEPRQERSQKLVMDTLFAASADIGRVTGKICASSDEFMAYANGLDIPGLEEGGRKVRIELAAQCVKDQAALLDEFAQ